MRAVYLEPQGVVSLRELPEPVRPPGHARIRVTLAGICNTDLELQRGYYGFTGVPGHEFVGVVEEADDPQWLGRRVVGEINLACGRCEWCARGLGRHCPARTVLGIVRHPGAFAEWITLPEENLLAVPDDLPDEAAVFTEPVAAACEISEQLGSLAGVPVAVLGDGKLGLLIAQVLAADGAAVTLVGRHEPKLAIAAAAGIAVTRQAPERQFPVTVDATGSARGLAQAVAMTSPRGRVVMKSTVAEPVALDMAPVIVNEISLTGSRCGRFQPALELLARGRVAVAPLIAARYPLAEAPAAFAEAASKGVLKVLLDVSPGYTGSTS